MTDSDVVKGTVIGAISIVGVILFAMMLFSNKPSASEEITYDEYNELRIDVSTNCPQLKPIIALWLQEYKGITRGKMFTFQEQCGKMHSAEIKRLIVEDFSK